MIMVMQMELKNKLFAILAIFCVIFSACAVCAADSNGVMGIDETYDDIDYGGAHDDVVVDESGMNDTFDGTEMSLNVTGSPNLNGTAQNQTDVNSTGNATVPGAGSNVSNVTNATANDGLPATGNPVLGLLAVSSLLGVASLYRKK